MLERAVLREKFTKPFSQIRTIFISEIEEEYDSPEHYDKDQDKRHSRGHDKRGEKVFSKNDPLWSEKEEGYESPEFRKEDNDGKYIDRR